MTGMTDRLITSLTNDTVKNVRALHMRKEREATGRFLAEGLKFIGEALDQQRAPRLLLVGEDARPHPILDRARAATRAAGGEVVVVTHAILEKISRRDNPQTVLGVFDQVYTPLSAIQPATAPAWVALEQVRDPGNLGTILRTLAWFGGLRCLLGPNSVDPFNPKTVRASMGALFHVPIEQDVPLESLPLNYAHLACLDMQGEGLATPAFRDSTCLIFGNEARGVPRAQTAALGARAFMIPGSGAIESLNLAAVVNMCAYELSRPLSGQ